MIFLFAFLYFIPIYIYIQWYSLLISKGCVLSPEDTLQIIRDQLGAPIYERPSANCRDQIGNRLLAQVIIFHITYKVNDLKRFSLDKKQTRFLNVPTYMDQWIFKLFYYHYQYLLYFHFLIIFKHLSRNNLFNITHSGSFLNCLWRFLVEI